MGIMFKPDMLELVLSGKKTQTRRKFKQGDQFLMHSVTAIRNGRTLYKYGRSYAIQPGYGKKAVGRVFIKHIKAERFCDISQADAEAEGFANPAGFFAKIREIYGADFDLTAPCWVLEFCLVEGKQP